MLPPWPASDGEFWLDAIAAAIALALTLAIALCAALAGRAAPEHGALEDAELVPATTTTDASSPRGSPRQGKRRVRFSDTVAVCGGPKRTGLGDGRDAEQVYEWLPRLRSTDPERGRCDWARRADGAPVHTARSLVW